MIYGLEGVNPITPKSVFLATPCANGLQHVEYVVSYLAMREALADAGIPLVTGWLTREPDVCRARNKLANQFMNSRCTHMLFIDADMQWSSADVLRLLGHDLPFVGGAGPKKTLELSGLQRYCCNLHPDMNGVNGKPLIEALHLGTGFLLLAREVFETLQNSGNVRQSDEGAKLTDYEWEFFRRDMAADHEGRTRNFSEDYQLCNMWRESGGSVWVDTLCDLGHIGWHNFRTDKLHTVLTGESEAAE